MNNSKIAIENTLAEEPEFDNKPLLREMQSQRTRIVQAIDRVKASKDWRMLEDELFEGIVEKLEKLLREEANKRPIDDAQIYYLQGQLVWAKKYADLEKLKEVFKVEVQNIKKQLK